MVTKSKVTKITKITKVTKVTTVISITINYEGNYMGTKVTN